MNKKTASAIMLTLLLTSMLTMAFNIKPVKAEGTIYIRADGSIDPPTAPIQRIGDTYILTGNISSDGNGIVIERENIVIDGASYTVQGTGKSGKGFYLYSITYVTIKNTNIENFFCGIHLNQSSHNNFHHNNIIHNYAGIGAEWAHDNVIADNIIAENGGHGWLGYGILAGYFDENTLNNNVFDGNCFGVWLSDSKLNTLRNNTFVDNDYSLEVWASFPLLNFVHDIDTSNTVNGYPMHYLVNQHDIVIEPHTFTNIGYLALVNSTNITIKDLNLQHIRSGQGILLGYCDDVTVTNVTISDCHSGIYIGSSHSLIIQDNSLFDNIDGITIIPSSDYLVRNNTIASNRNGMSIYQSCGNGTIQENQLRNNSVGINLLSGNHTVVENTIEGSTWGGIALVRSSLWYDFTQPDHIYHNFFVGNTPQVYFEGGESSGGYLWDDDYPSGGNYWSDYETRYPDASEIDGSGLWDTPYVIDENNQDNYPFMNPWTPTYVQGIDVSHYPGDINWAEVYGAGYKFAFVKATEGEGWTGDPEARDERFEINMNESRAAGMLVGAYHYARPDLNPEGAVDEATWFVEVTREYIGLGYLRPALDLEEGEGLESLSQWVCDWMETVEDLTGVRPILYTGYYFATDNLDSSVAGYDLWIAQWTYDLKVGPSVPTYWDQWDFWQWSNESQYAPLGYVPGVEGNALDLDVFNGVLQDLYRDFVIPIPGDVNGDWTVNILDAIVLANVFGSRLGDANWNPNADFNGDKVVNILDAIILASNFGRRWP
ncbi:right-handed parallel beta-helix repeat-containing protein [Candidatus Bathyarchaeota archaeon]|nr:right-handed parallel beta-helix repeat-containing protein [Candidatus Bathyarchaeota archaeon]